MKPSSPVIASRVLGVAAVLSVAALQLGCAQTFYTRPGSLTPATATVPPAERTLVWQHAVGALLQQGYVPQVLNEGAGYISARRREDIADDALLGTMATVLVSPEGAVRVELSGAGLFNSERTFLDAVTARQSQIMQAIMSSRAPAR
jgi:hypothetical protein